MTEREVQLKRENFIYEVITRVSFIREDIDFLIECSENHYDRKCKKLSDPNGFLFEMRSILIYDSNMKIGFFDLTMDDLDILCKVTEPLLICDRHKLPMHKVICELWEEANAQKKCLNARNV